MTTINRPEVGYEAGPHTYMLGDEELIGVSTVAKIGEDEVWGIASAWGYRIGYEGAFDVLRPDLLDSLGPTTKDEMRAELQKRGLTPWSKRDKAAERGTWVHDTLEALAQTGQAPTLTDFPEGVRGYVRGVLRWYLDYRPSFVATEVQVASETHGFAGRYDIRCRIQKFILNEQAAIDTPDEYENLCLVDLKTSKGVYPTSHFPQLAGYELASVEMGFPATDAQFVLNVKEDGTYEFKRSWAGSRHFLAYLAAARAIRDIKDNDPEVLRERAITAEILTELENGPRTARELADAHPGWDMDPRKIGFLLGGLRRKGQVSQGGRSRWTRA